MTVEQAIEKAIEGGLVENTQWKLKSANRYWVIWVDGAGADITIPLEKYLLDPLFWQSLGKALGWKIENSSHQPYGIGWIYYWHRFVDFLAEGKSAEDFFKEL